MGPKFLNIIKALALPFNIVTSIFSVYGFCTNIAGRFVDTKIDIILNFIIVVQFFTSVCAINLVFYSKTTKILNLLNQVIYLKKLVLRLNDNPFLDNKVVGFFLRRWAASTVIIIYLSIISAEAQITMPIARIYIFLAISGFCYHYIWFITAVSSLLSATLFAAHLMLVITNEMKGILRKWNWINRNRRRLKPGLYLDELWKLSERINYLSFSYFEVMKFVQTMVSIAQISLLLIVCNVFLSIITDTGNLYMRALRKTPEPKVLMEMIIFFGFLLFALNELYFMNYGPQKLLNRVKKLQELVSSASMASGRGDNRVDKSVSKS